MSNVRAVHNAEYPFVQLSKVIINMKGLSFAAKGFLTYMLSKPDNWNTNVAQVSRDFDISERSTYKMINELIKFNLCKKERGRKIGPSGRIVYDRVDYVFLEVPCDDETFKEMFQQCDSSLLQNAKVQTNSFSTEIQTGHYNIDIINKKDVANAPSSSSFSSAIKRTNNVQNAPPKNLPSQAIQLAALLLELIQVRSPKAKADINEWAKHIDKMNRIDKFSWLEIENIIRYVHQKDKFWFKAVLSAKKLREKASTLVIYMNDYQDDKDPQKEFNDYFS